jgi:uncharacterized protein YjhX (UPF0386 family)
MPRTRLVRAAAARLRGRRDRSRTPWACPFSTGPIAGLGTEAQNKITQTQRVRVLRPRLVGALMADTDSHSHVRVNSRTGEFEISGSEEFIEKMLERLPTLIATAEPEPDDPDDDDDDGDDSGGRKGRLTLDAFVEKYKVESQNNQTRALAFVYFLTKIQRNTSCSVDEIRKCFEDSGVDEPDHLPTVLNNLKKTGHVASAGSGRYKVTSSKGSKAIKALATG